MKLTLKTARILVFLSQTELYLRYGAKISEKLDLDYNSLMQLMKRLVCRGWIIATKHKKIVYYTISSRAPLQLAKETIVGIGNSKEIQECLEVKSNGN